MLCVPISNVTLARLATGTGPSTKLVPSDSVVPGYEIDIEDRECP